MSDPNARIADQWRTVADGFTVVAESVGAGQWENDTPCEGWVARDVIGHLVEWVPPFIAAGSGVEVSVPTSVTDDPVQSWREFDGAVHALLSDPEVAASTFRHPQAGEHRFDTAISMFVLTDVLIHTWDLAQAIDREVRLDPATVEGAVVGMEAAGDALVASGHYGPATSVPADADPQTRLLVATGRRP
jgi:uncharacterized protein (TIGR03086 family)